MIFSSYSRFSSEKELKITIMDEDEERRKPGVGSFLRSVILGSVMVGIGSDYGDCDNKVSSSK